MDPNNTSERRKILEVLERKEPNADLWAHDSTGEQVLGLLVKRRGIYLVVATVKRMAARTLYAMVKADGVVNDNWLWQSADQRSSQPFTFGGFVPGRADPDVAFHVFQLSESSARSPIPSSSASGDSLDGSSSSSSGAQGSRSSSSQPPGRGPGPGGMGAGPGGMGGGRAFGGGGAQQGGSMHQLRVTPHRLGGVASGVSHIGSLSSSEPPSSASSQPKNPSPGLLPEISLGPFALPEPPQNDWAGGMDLDETMLNVQADDQGLNNLTLPGDDERTHVTFPGEQDVDYQGRPFNPGFLDDDLYRWDTDDVLDPEFDPFRSLERALEHSDSEDGLSDGDSSSPELVGRRIFLERRFPKERAADDSEVHRFYRTFRTQVALQSLGSSTGSLWSEHSSSEVPQSKGGFNHYNRLSSYDLLTGLLDDTQAGRPTPKGSRPGTATDTEEGLAAAALYRQLRGEELEPSLVGLDRIPRHVVRKAVPLLQRGCFTRELKAEDTRENKTAEQPATLPDPHVLTSGDTAKRHKQLWRTVMQYCKVLKKFRHTATVTRSKGHRHLTTSASTGSMPDAPPPALRQNSSLTESSAHTASSLEELRTRLTRTPSEQPVPRARGVSVTRAPPRGGHVQPARESDDRLKGKRIQYTGPRINSRALEMKKPLGKGAFGNVVMGRLHGRFDVALKQIDVGRVMKIFNLEKSSKQAEQVMLDAFLWEAQCLSTVKHPSLVRFHGASLDGDHPCLVMEYCSERDLERNIELARDPEYAWRWAVQIAQGIAAIHAHGMVHKDIKLENVLITKDFNAKVSDLGLARVDRLVQEMEFVSTRGVRDQLWASPEELNQEEATTESDIFVVGTVLWALAHAQKPFVAETEDELERERARVHQFVSEGRMQKMLPIDGRSMFCGLIRDCWATDPADRPTAKELVDRLTKLAPRFFAVQTECCRQLMALRLAPALEKSADDRRTYVAPYCTSNSDITAVPLNQVEKARVTQSLTRAVLDFVKSRDRVFVIQGNGGLGKSLTLEYLCAKGEGQVLPLRAVLRTWRLSSLKDGIAAALDNEFFNLPDELRRPCVLKKMPLLVLVDGYEELHDDLGGAAGSLPALLGLDDWPMAKLIVTCRRDVVTDVVQQFGLENETTCVRYVLPFDQSQITKYCSLRGIPQVNPAHLPQLNVPFFLRLYSAGADATAPRLGGTKGAAQRKGQQLSETKRDDNDTSVEPVEVVEEDRRAYATRTALFHTAIREWVQRGENSLSKAVVDQLKDRHGSLYRSFVAFASAVAMDKFLGVEELRRDVADSDVSLGSESSRAPWTQVETIVEKEALKEFDLAQGEQGVHFIKNTDYVDMQLRVLRLWMQESPLQETTPEEEEPGRRKRGRKRGGKLVRKLKRSSVRRRSYRFVHKSFEEYFVARAMHDTCCQEASQGTWPKNLCADGFIGTLPISTDLVTKNYAVFSILTEFVKLRTLRVAKTYAAAWPVTPFNPATMTLFCKALFDLVEASKHLGSPPLRSVRVAAANALSLLVAGGVHFIGMDFRGVWACELEDEMRERQAAGTDQLLAPFADLSGGNFTGSNLEDAHLYNARWELVRLNRSSLRGADLRKGRFGQAPFIPFKTRMFGYSMCVAPERREVVVGDAKLACVPLEAKREAPRRVFLDMARVHAVYVDEARGWLFAGGKKGSGGILWAFDFNTTEKLWEQSHKGTVLSLTLLDRDPPVLVSADRGGFVRQFDPQTGEEVRPCIQLKARDGLWTGDQRNYAWGVCGVGKDELAVAARDGNAYVYASQEPDKPPVPLKGHSDYVKAVASHGTIIATGSYDHSVILWKKEGSGWPRAKTLSRHTDKVNSLQFYRRARALRLISASADGTVAVWSVETGLCLRQFWDHQALVHCARVDLLTQRVVSMGEDYRIRLFSLDSMQIIRQRHFHTAGVMGLVVDPRTQVLVSASMDGFVALWCMRSGKLLRRLEGHVSRVLCAGLLRDGDATFIVSGAQDKRACVWNLDSGDLIGEGQHGKSVTCVAVDRTRPRFVTGSNDETIRVWSLVSKSRVKEEFSFQCEEKVRAISLDPSGTRLFSVLEGSAIVVWSMKDRTRDFVVELSSVEPCLLAGRDAFLCGTQGGFFMGHAPAGGAPRLIPMEDARVECMAWDESSGRLAVASRSSGSVTQVLIFRMSVLSKWSSKPENEQTSPPAADSVLNVNGRVLALSLHRDYIIVARKDTIVVYDMDDLMKPSQGNDCKEADEDAVALPRQVASVLPVWQTPHKRLSARGCDLEDAQLDDDHNVLQQLQQL